MLMREIPFFNYKELYLEEREEFKRILDETCAKGAYIMQQELIDFEKALANYLGVKYAIGTADGTMAIITGLIAAGLEQDDEVLVPTHTFVATASAIHHAGGKPVLVDCGKDHLIDPVSVKKHITKKTKAILPVQLNGRTADMDSITAIAEDNNLFIVEDSCQALGSKFKNKYAGTFGKAGAFSFYPSKTLGCFGDGGAVVTNDAAVAEKIILLRDHGRGADGKIWCFGFNARLDNIHAAILGYKLKHYNRYIDKRRSLAARYNELLCGIEELLLPPSPDADIDHFDIYQNYEIEAKRRDELQNHLAENGIGTIKQWGGFAIHQSEKLGLNSDLPYADEMTKNFLMLPMNTTLKLEEIDYICDKIKDFYSK
jgi:dTDP-4-amino-4,6-dideoxygalactose transaminase